MLRHLRGPWRALIGCGGARLSTLGGSRPANFKNVIRSGVKRVQCDICNYVFYENPKVIGGVVATYQEEPEAEPLYLLVRRAIKPRRGFWSHAGGFVEMYESVCGGAVREASEETNADVQPGKLLAMYNIIHIGQVLMYYDAQMLNTDIGPRAETLESRLFKWEEIPWDDLAFPANAWALMHHRMFREREAIRKQLETAENPDPELIKRYLALDEPPYDIPKLPGYENTLDIWYSPEKGLYHDDSWLSKPEWTPRKDTKVTNLKI